MDLSLDKKQLEYINLIKELGEQKIIPYSSKPLRASDSSFDWQLIKILGEYNLVCPTIPEEYGGLGLDRFTTALIWKRLQRFVLVWLRWLIPMFMRLSHCF